MLLQFGWSANNASVRNDPGVKVGRAWNPRTKQRTPATGGGGFGAATIEPLLAAGIGVATFNYADIEPDSLDSFQQGIIGHYMKPGQTERAGDDWGSICAWAGRQPDHGLL